jgi:hypothetical protein
MHKTFTDCYLADGFTGGGWAYSSNSNDADGHTIDDTPSIEVEEKERRLAYYVIGWKSLEVSLQPITYLGSKADKVTRLITPTQKHPSSTKKSIT